MCIAGDDVWHLDCDKVRAEQGIHTGLITIILIHIRSCAIYITFCVFKLFCLSVMDTLTCCYTDTESSSEGSRSRSRTRSVGTTPSPPG